MLIPHRLGNCGTSEAQLKFTQADAGLYLNGTKNLEQSSLLGD